MNKSHYNVSRLQNTQGSIDVDYNDSVEESAIRQTIEDVGCKIL